MFAYFKKAVLLLIVTGIIVSNSAEAYGSDTNNPGYTNFTSVSAIQDLIITSGDHGYIYSSNNFVDWKSSNFTTHHLVKSIAGSEDKFVAVGLAGEIFSSSDRIHWVKQNSGISNDLNAIAEYKGHFVAVGTHGIIVTSKDAVNWISVNSGISLSLNAITVSDNGKFIAVGDQGIIISSDNGINWHMQGEVNSHTLRGISVNKKGVVVAVGAPAIIISGDNALNWYTASYNYINDSFSSVAINSSNQFVATERNGTVVSANAYDNLMVYPIFHRFRGIGANSRVTYSEYYKRFILVGMHGQIFVSSDGLQWVNYKSEKQIVEFSINGHSAVVHGNEIIVSLPEDKIADNSRLIAKFKAIGGVTVNGIIQISGVTENNFNLPLTYTVHAADGSSVDYKIKIRNNFICIADGKDPCGCLKQNDGTSNPLVWYRYSSTSLYTFNEANQGFIKKFNYDGHCGYRDWRIPSVITNSTLNKLPLNDSKDVSGDFADLVRYAVLRGYISGNTSLAAWLNQHGFGDGWKVDIQGAKFWSDSFAIHDKNLTYALTLNHNAGGLLEASNQNDSHFVLPVRGGVEKGTNNFTEFAIDGYRGKFEGSYIKVKVPRHHNLLAKATFNGSNIFINGIKQISNKTENNFNNPVTYELRDTHYNLIKVYTVIVDNSSDSVPGSDSTIRDNDLYINFSHDEIESISISYDNSWVPSDQRADIGFDINQIEGAGSNKTLHLRFRSGRKGSSEIANQFRNFVPPPSTWWASKYLITGISSQGNSSSEGPEKLNFLIKVSLNVLDKNNKLYILDPIYIAQGHNGIIFNNWWIGYRSWKGVCWTGGLVSVREFEFNLFPDDMKLYMSMPHGTHYKYQLSTKKLTTFCFYP